MFRQLVVCYKDYQNDASKHDDNYNETEVAFVVEMTSSLMYWLSTPICSGPALGGRVHKTGSFNSKRMPTRPNSGTENEVKASKSKPLNLTVRLPRRSFEPNKIATSEKSSAAARKAFSRLVRASVTRCWL